MNRGAEMPLFLGDNGFNRFGTVTLWIEHIQSPTEFMAWPRSVTSPALKFNLRRYA